MWIHDEIHRLKAEGNFGGDATTRTIRIPKQNSLTRSLDVTAVLEQRSRLNSTANAFDYAVASPVPEFSPDERAQVLGGLASEIPRRGRGFVESLSAPTSTPWPQAPKDSFAGRLNVVDQYVRWGDTESARRMLDQLSSSLDIVSSLERAEFWYLTGRCWSLEGNDKQALQAYATAHAEEPAGTRYLLLMLKQNCAFGTW